MKWQTRSSALATLPIILFLALSQAQPVYATTCAELLSSIATAPASIPGPLRSGRQGELVAKEMAVRGLIEEYARRLGPFQDPFALAFNADQGNRIFQKLSVRDRNGRSVKSPLAIVNDTLKTGFVSQRPLNIKLVDWILKDATELVRSGETNQSELQSNLLALKYTLEYLRRYREPETIIDRDGKTEEKKNESKKQEQKREEQAEEDAPPEYPDLPKEYKPFTKNTDNQGKGKQKQHRVAEVNFKTPFFAQRYFSDIVRGATHPFKEAILPSTPNAPGSFKPTGRELVVRTYGKSQVDLFLPPLFKPLQPSDPRATVSRSETGGYVLSVNGDLSEIRIPLTEDQGINILKHIREIYTRRIGFNESEWPDKVQAEVIRKFDVQDAKTTPLQVAQAVADHIATQYLYSVGERQETDPVEALKAGSFQCDMAAYTMVGILRDVYGIPCRVVGGFRAKKHQSDKDAKSYLVVPGEAHAWVEVFDNGKWNLFDPTPVKKDRKKDENGDGEYSDHQLENTPRPEPESDESESAPKQSASPSPATGSKAGKKDHKERLDEATAARTKDIEPNGNKNEKEKKDKDSRETEDGDLNLNELANRLELGSLELEPRFDRNALLERAMRVLLQITVEPTQRGADIQNRLNQLASVIKRFNRPELKQLFNEAQSAHANDHPDLKNWLDGLVRLMPTQDLNKTYQELHRIRLALEVYARVTDGSGKIPEPTRLVETLTKVQARLQRLAHPDSQDIAIVQDLVKNLPAVVRQLLKSQYDLDSVGPNAPTKEVARRLKAGSMNDLRLLSILSPLSDFILNSSPRPETIEVKTWQRDSSRPRGRELLPLQRFSDIVRALLGQPGKSIEDNIREGTAFVPTRRQRVDIPQGYGKEESERITIVLYDTSGSMSGDPGRFQAGLISAFTAKALSDVSPAGRNRHRVVLVPFDDNVGAPTSVTNSQEAIAVIRDYQKKLKNTGGGTDIQKAMLQAMALIADAEKRSGEPLAAANIVLMTDGQAQINSADLLQARKAIDRQTPLQTMFIAINQTNEELMRFAMDSQSMGVEKGFYREFTGDHIKDVLNEADHPNLSQKEKAFYSDKQGSELPSEVYDLMDEALRLSQEFTDQIYYGTRTTSAKEHLDALEGVRWRDMEHADRPLEQWLIKIRNFVQHPIFKDKKVLERVTDDIVRNIEHLTGVRMDEMSDHEQEQLRHLVRFAAGLEGPP